MKKWIYLYDPRKLIIKRARSESPIDPVQNEEETLLEQSADVLRIKMEHNYSKSPFSPHVAPRETSSQKCGIIRDNPSQVFPLKFHPRKQEGSNILRLVSPKQNMHCYVEKLK